MSTLPVREDILKAFRERIKNGMWAPGLEISNSVAGLGATCTLWRCTPQTVARVFHRMADEGLLERTEYGWKVPGVTPNGYAYPPTTEGAVARIQAYLDATPDVFNVGGDFAYGKQFQSEEWPRAVYTPTRPDIEELLRALRQAQAEAYQYRTALQGATRRDDLLAEVTRLRAELGIGAPWKCPVCSKENTRAVCVICETDRPDEPEGSEQ